MHENVTTIKLPNLDQTALYFVWPWFLMMWQEYHVFGSSREGVQRKGKKRTQRRLDCTIITFLLSIWVL